MKNVKKLFIPLICAGLFLTGCNERSLDAFIEMQPLTYEPETVDDVEISEDIEETTSEEEFRLLKAKDISFAFNTTVSLMGYSFSVEYYETEDFTGWWTEVLDTTERDNSKDMALFMSSFLPDYVYIWKYGYIEATDARDNEYAVVSVNPNISSAVEVYSYLDNDNLNAEIYIYDIY